MNSAILNFASKSSQKLSKIGGHEKTQMTVIAVKELENMLDSRTEAGPSAEAAFERKIQIVGRAIHILIRCDYESAVRDYILSLALDTQRPKIGKRMRREKLL